MPRYYFDTDDGEHADVDEDGQEMASFESARDEAVRILPAIANEVLPNGRERTFVSVIRDENGKRLFRATLTFKGKQLR